MGWTYNMALMRYGQYWRAHRRVFHQHFYHAIVEKYESVQIQHIREFLSWILKSPEDARKHVRQ